MILIYIGAAIIGLFILHAVISSAVQNGILDALDSIQKRREKQAFLEELENESTPSDLQTPEVIKVEDSVFAEMEDLLSDLEQRAPNVKKITK